MPRWEYRVVRLVGEEYIPRADRADRTATQDALNLLGSEGWELVSAQLVGSPHPYLDQYYVLRRPVE